jgi:hypothetical protein
MWFASPLRNCPSLEVGFPSRSNSFPHFSSIVVNSTFENERLLAGRAVGVRSENLTPVGLSSGLVDDVRIGSASGLVGFICLGAAA